jgi:hypothetical protein
MVEFFQTLMGRKFYDSQVPMLVRSIGSIAQSLEILSERQTQTIRREALLEALQVVGSSVALAELIDSLEE